MLSPNPFRHDSTNDFEVVEPIQLRWPRIRTELPGSRWLAFFAAVSLGLHSFVLFLLAGIEVVRQGPIVPAMDTQAQFLDPDPHAFPTSSGIGGFYNIGVAELRDGTSAIGRPEKPTDEDKMEGVEITVRGFLHSAKVYTLGQAINTSEYSIATVSTDYQQEYKQYYICGCSEGSLAPCVDQEVILTGHARVVTPYLPEYLYLVVTKVRLANSP